MFVERVNLNEKQKQEVSEMCGKIVLWILEGRGTYYMADQLKLSPMEVNQNMDEFVYMFKKEIGLRRFLRILFRK